MLWRLLSQRPHAQRAVTRSCSAARLSRSFQGKAESPIIHTDALSRLGSQVKGKFHHQPWKPYSNFAPKGVPPYGAPSQYDVPPPYGVPPPYYNPHVEPTRSRGSRLKDMALGSVLTLAVLGLVFVYTALDILTEHFESVKKREELEELRETVNETMKDYDRRLKAAETNGASEDEIREIFRERSMAYVLLTMARDGGNKMIENLGPLPRLPEGQKLPYEFEAIKEEDTLVLLPPEPTDKETDYSQEEVEEEFTPLRARNFFVGINASTEDMKLIEQRMGEEDIRFSSAEECRFAEVVMRSINMVQGFMKDGKFNPKRPTIVVLFFRDTERIYLYHRGWIQQVVPEPVGAKSRL